MGEEQGKRKENEIIGGIVAIVDIVTIVTIVAIETIAFKGASIQFELVDARSGRVRGLAVVVPREKVARLGFGAKRGGERADEFPVHEYTVRVVVEYDLVT